MLPQLTKSFAVRTCKIFVLSTEFLEPSNPILFPRVPRYFPSPPLFSSLYNNKIPLQSSLAHQSSSLLQIKLLLIIKASKQQEKEGGKKKNMAAMASTAFTPSVSSTTNKLFDSSFHGAPMSPSLLRLQPIKSARPNNLSISASASASPPYDLNTFKFDPIKESIVSREMTRRYIQASKQAHTH